MRSRHPVLVVALAAVALLASACADAFRAGAAVVNGTGISQDLLDERIQALSPGAPTVDDQLRRDALRQLIEEEIVRQETARRDLAVADGAVEERFEQARTFFPTEEQFFERLGQLGFTAESFKDVLHDQLTREVLAADIAGPITDELVRQAYEADHESFEEARIRHILLQVSDPAEDEAVRARALNVLQRIRDGEPFATVAREVSEDPGSKDQGGDLGFAALSRYVPEFAAAAANAEVGRVTDPVRSQFGYHLILVVERRIQPLEDVAEVIRDRLRSQRTDEVIGEFLEDAVKRASIQINPRYGEWDPETGTVVPLESFVPASPAPDPNVPPEDLFLPPGG